MSDLNDLYREVILEHNNNPRNCRECPHATHCACGDNPLCGDKVTIYLHIKDDIIEEASFQGAGCAISIASASLLTEHLTGKRVEEAQAVFEKFQEMATRDDPTSELSEELGKLAAFGGVCQFPARVKCATLAWHTLKSALENDEQAQSKS